MKKLVLLLSAMVLISCGTARAARDSGEGIAEGGGASSFSVFVGGVRKGIRGAINFIAGTNTTITGVDNPSARRVDVTVTASGGTNEFTQMAVGTNTVSGVKINSRAQTSDVFQRLFLDSTNGLFSTFSFLEIYSNYSFDQTPRLKGTFQFNVNVGKPQFRFNDANGVTTFLYDFLSGQTSFGKGVGAFVANNSAMFNGSIGVTQFDVNGSTTIPTYASPDYAQVGYIYSISASGGNATVTLEQTTIPYLPYGRLRKICKSDSSSNTVTIGSVVLTAQNQCAEFVVRAPSPGNSGIWTNVGVTVPDLSVYLLKSDIPSCNATTEMLHWTGSAFECVAK